MHSNTPAVLAIENLSVSFESERGTLLGVRDVTLAVARRECVGVVGESASGKTQTFMAAMGLLPPGAHAAGSVCFEGRELLGRSAAQMNTVRGSKLTMIFQDAMSALTPHLKIGVQLAEVLVTHTPMTWREANQAALAVLERVQVPDASRRLRQYPHELSGGMRQRVMIGMNLLCEPSLLIADEPTSALDVTVQVQIIELLRALRRESNTALVLISHDLAVVAALADRIVVMYAGRIVESAAASELLRHAQHPYTAALLDCVPVLRGPRLARMHSIPGSAPDPATADEGCAFAPRCARAGERCRTERPVLRTAPAAVLAAAHAVACHSPVSG